MSLLSISSPLVKKSVCNLYNINYSLQKKFFSGAKQNQKRCELFALEQKRQKEKVGRIEKIEIRYLGLPKDTTLMMNKGISTPYNCAQHLSEMHCKKSALALIDNNIPWDMHRPIEESCTLQLLNFNIADPHLVNRAFWRSCSFLLGAALEKCFKDEAGLFLHSFPSPNIKSGSFVYDISLEHNDWRPNPQELRAISAEMVKFGSKNLSIERLDVSHDLALEMFMDNPFKREQLPSISNRNNGLVTLYKVDDHIDISRGPMISSTSFIGKCTISSVHSIADKSSNCYLYRVQGVALPVGFTLNHFVYGILEQRSRKLNPARLPHEPFEENTVETNIA